MYPKVFIGPMSHNIVKAAVDLHNQYPIGFIPSRRQVDIGGGYTGWDQQDFSGNVPLDITIQRDHGGPGQGMYWDDGVDSLTHDARYFDAIHIDPWKAYPNYIDGIERTINLIEMCDSINKELTYEIGTEEAIRPFSKSEYESMFYRFKTQMSSDIYKRIKYVVVQSGTKLDLPNQRNTGEYNEDKLKSQLVIIKYHGKKSKEHNGDYLTAGGIARRFALGVDAINIAPEFGQYETEAYLELMDKEQEEEFFRLCLASPHWKKWVEPDFDPYKEKQKLMLTAGHYIFGDLEFNLPVYDILLQKMKVRLESIYAGV